MISIIVSSYKEDLFIQFSNNVKQTIGEVPYEIIQINNPGLMGICEAYNKGGNAAKYPYLVFAHEDILFHTQGWGLLLSKIFESDKKIGLLGVAGGQYKSFMYSGWPTLPQLNRIYMIGTHHGRSHISKLTEFENNCINDMVRHQAVPPIFFTDEVQYEQVAVLDGMILITTKSVFENTKFDELNLKGFHCYDLDYSLAVKKSGHQVVVTYNILIEHFSPGYLTKEWINNIKIFNKKWAEFLPAGINDWKVAPNLEAEYKALEEYLRLLSRNNYNVAKCLPVLFDYRFIRLLGRRWLIIASKISSKISQLVFSKLKSKISTVKKAV